MSHQGDLTVVLGVTKRVSRHWRSSLAELEPKARPNFPTKSESSFYESDHGVALLANDHHSTLTLAVPKDAL